MLFRHSARRAWSSWFVKVAVIFGWIPPALALVIFGFQFAMTKAAAAQNAALAQGIEEKLNPAELLRTTYDWQFWMFLTLITLGSGATAIARDFEFSAFRFYLAKPVEPWQYLVARVLGVAAWCFAITWLPALLFCVGASAIASRPEHLGLALPATLYAAILSTSLALASVAISATSRSRGLTMSLWVVVLVVPHTLAGILARASETHWADLMSLPALLGRVGDALFRLENTEGLEIVYAAPALAIILAFLGAFAWRRVENAEVIT